MYTHPITCTHSLSFPYNYGGEWRKVAALVCALRAPTYHNTNLNAKHPASTKRTKHTQTQPLTCTPITRTFARARTPRAKIAFMAKKWNIIFTPRTSKAARYRRTRLRDYLVPTNDSCTGEKKNVTRYTSRASTLPLPVTGSGFPPSAFRAAHDTVYLCARVQPEQCGERRRRCRFVHSSLVAMSNFLSFLCARRCERNFHARRARYKFH